MNNVLLLESTVNSAVKHQKDLALAGIESCIAEKDDLLKKEDWEKNLKDLIRTDCINLIVADTGFHLDSMKFLVSIEQTTGVKVIYLSYQEKKYDKGDLPGAYILIEELNRSKNSQILIDLIKELAN